MHDLKESFRRTIIVMALGSVILSVGWYWLSTLPVRPGQTIMRLSEVTITGPTALCPGETLNYDQTLTVNAAGVFDMDVSVWRVTPPTTVLFSLTRRMVFAEPKDFSLGREWEIPAKYIDLETNEPREWTPGDYERVHSIVTVSRTTTPSIVRIPFSIRGDCK